MGKITIQLQINQPLDKVWDSFTSPEHIVNWNFASPDWHCTTAENHLEVGGCLKSRMEAKDGSFGFDFEGVYDNVITHELLIYHLEDQRSVEIRFNQLDDNLIEISQTFDPETENPIEMQRAGWMAILDQFKVYTESL
ncbi:SRPBCC family protein [Chryseobacterium sp. T1]